MRFAFEKDSFISASPEALFELHERPDAFNLLSPRDLNIEVMNTATTLRPSDEVVEFAVRALGIRFPFAMVHTVYDKPHRFVDEQLRGPFSTWKHEHRFKQGGWRRDPATLLRDRIDYAHPLLFLGKPFVARPLEQLFTLRHGITRVELEGAVSEASKMTGKRVIVTGATGLIGGRITEILLEKGCHVTVFARDVDRARRLFGEHGAYAQWDFTKPDVGDWRQPLAQADAVIHLAGTPLFGKRWNAEFKREMEESRTLSTRSLVQAIEANEHKPEVFVSASAVGVYGMNPSILAEESTPSGNDLLARICVNWEGEARALEASGVRTAQLRFGVVLSPESGALKEMLPIFKLGVGGVLGKADTWINWIHLEDAARIAVMALQDESTTGPINAVAPHPVTNKTFAHSLARVLRRPSVFRYPSFFMKLVIGEAGEYSSGGPRVSSEQVQERGYDFFFEELEPALRNLLRRPAADPG